MIAEGLTVLTHPNNYEILTKALEKHIKKTEQYIFRPAELKIITNSNIIEQEVDTQELWERTNILPDNNLVTWIDDIKNPPSWAIYFGLVKIKTKPVFYMMNRKCFIENLI